MSHNEFEIDPITEAALGFAHSCINRMEELIADGMSAREAKHRTMNEAFSPVLNALRAADSEAAQS